MPSWRSCADTILDAIAANYARDLAYLVHALIAMAISGGMFLWVLRGIDEPEPAPETGYMDGVIRYGVIATAFWGVIRFIADTFIALQLAFPYLTFDWSNGHLNFGSQRPLHTSAVIFAFGGNALICTSFWVVQRTSAARLWGGMFNGLMTLFELTVANFVTQVGPDVDNCAACRGEDGTGDPFVGAPNLTDAIWLYGGDPATVDETVTYSRFGVMPVWGPRLTQSQVNAVSPCVHQLGGGEMTSDGSATWRRRRGVSNRRSSLFAHGPGERRRHLAWVSPLFC